MPSIALRGVRGGVGCSAIAAGLGQFLADNGHRVLLVDMCPENLLGLYFQLPANQARGWAWAYHERSPWQDQAWQLTEHLALLPYGLLRTREVLALEEALKDSRAPWAQRREQLETLYDWVIFDTPCRLPYHRRLGEKLIWLDIAQADAACHVLLSRAEQPIEHLLINGFDPANALQRDVALVWQAQYQTRLLGMRVHHDAAFGEALACKTAITRAAPQSLGSQDIKRLATWCLSNAKHPL